MPALHLRRLGVFVDEPDPGDFYAVIAESKEDASVWFDVWSSAEPFGTWFEAWTVGNSRLLSMVTDRSIGPRGAGEDENASPVG